MQAHKAHIYFLYTHIEYRTTVYRYVPSSELGLEEKLNTLPTLWAVLWIVKGRHDADLFWGFRCRLQFGPSACHQAVRSHLRPWICPPPSHQTSNTF
jgi:hypothetical protein